VETTDVDGHNIFHRVPQFKYLGVLLTQGNEVKVDFKKNTTGQQLVFWYGKPAKI